MTLLSHGKNWLMFFLKDSFWHPKCSKLVMKLWIIEALMINLCMKHDFIFKRLCCIVRIIVTHIRCGCKYFARVLIILNNGSWSTCGWRYYETTICCCFNFAKPNGENKSSMKNKKRRSYFSIFTCDYENTSKDQEHNENMVWMMTQLDIITKHVICNDP